jgi:uncharacterized protein (TIRG00374 family)
MNKQTILKILKFTIRWGIAVFGIWYVISKMSWNDRVWAILPGYTMPQSVALSGETSGETDATYPVIDPTSGKVEVIGRSDVVNEPDRAKMQVTEDGKKQFVVGVDLSDDLKHANRLLLADGPAGPTAHWADPATVPDYRVVIPHPRVQIGVIRMVRRANPIYLIAALLVFPITVLITSLRWHELLKALDIVIPISRVFVLNMVGLFYNTFMPGSTGGDVLKAFYVAKQTHHGTRAVMSVIVDRAIGLIALIILGGTMATFQWHNAKCRQVALGSAAILSAAALGMILFYVPMLRRFSGLDWIIGKLPMQKQVVKAIETMHIFGRRPFLVTGATIVSFPVHMIVIISAMLAGMAFNLPIHLFYYWMAVPVIVLAGSIPISPQGAGVMEYFAINLLSPQGVTVGQAFALTMSIRLTQMFWNLTGGYFVVRGGFHAPTKSEKEQVEAEDEDEIPTDPKANPPLADPEISSPVE